MPLELHTWTMAWILSSRAYLGLGLDLTDGFQQVQLRYIPETLIAFCPERSSIAYRNRTIAVHLGQTPMGSGCYLKYSRQENGLTIYQNNKRFWAQWNGKMPIKHQITFSPQLGWAAQGQSGPWMIILAPNGQNSLCYQQIRIRGQFNFSRSHWQSRVHIQPLYLIAGGKKQWDFTRLGLARNGQCIELQENHSIEGFIFQVLAKLNYRSIKLYGWFREGAGPMSWLCRLEYPVGSPFTGVVQWSSSPWLRQGILMYKGRKGGHVSASIHHKGIYLQVGKPNLSLQIQKDRAVFKWKYPFPIPHKKGPIPLEIGKPMAPRLHILSNGLIEHPILRCSAIDENGQEFGIHLIGGEVQWKTHLPPGRYTWKTLPSHQTQGYMIQFLSPTFVLETNQTTVIHVIIEKQPKDIFWIGGSPST